MIAISASRYTLYVHGGIVDTSQLISIMNNYARTTVLLYLEIAYTGQSSHFTNVDFLYWRELRILGQRFQIPLVIGIAAEYATLDEINIHNICYKSLYNERGAVSRRLRYLLTSNITAYDILTCLYLCPTVAYWFYGQIAHVKTLAESYRKILLFTITAVDVDTDRKQPTYPGIVLEYHQSSIAILAKYLAYLTSVERTDPFVPCITDLVHG